MTALGLVAAAGLVWVSSPAPCEQVAQQRQASSGDAVVCFCADGMQGPIEGLVVIRGERIEEVVLLRSREGLEHDALSVEHLAAYQGQEATPPTVVDAVSGATVSSRVLAAALDERLAAWRSTTGVDQ